MRNRPSLDKMNRSHWLATMSTKTKSHLIFAYDFIEHSEHGKKDKAGIIKVALSGKMNAEQFDATYWDYKPIYRIGNMLMTREPIEGKPKIRLNHEN